MNLWASGSNATLKIETHAEEACASLQVGLGQHLFKVEKHSFEVKKKVSHSRNCRRARGAAVFSQSNTGTVVENNLPDMINASKTVLNSGDHDAEKAAASDIDKIEVPADQNVVQVDSSDLSSIHDVDTEKVDNDVDVCTFNFCNDAYGNIGEVK